MTNIVIAGAGFGGLQLALKLEKKFRGRKDIALTVVDKHDYHVFTPNLFEAATADEELVSQAELESSIALPLAKVFHGKNLKFIKSPILVVDVTEKRLDLGGKKLPFDYLVLALGSKTDFFGIEGAEKYALTLKNLPDALRIRNRLEFAMQAHRMDANKPNLRVVVAGGGYTGVELAGELKGLMDFLAWKNQYPREKVEIEVIEAAPKLIPGFDNRLSDDAYARLREMGIRVALSARIAKVDEHFVELMSGEKLAYDVLLWTTGVKACELSCSKTFTTLDKKGRVAVNEYFQVQGQHNIFALGDMACVLDAKGQPVPSSAQDAVDQARYLADALPYFLLNQKPPKAYHNHKHGFIVNISGKWAIISYNNFYNAGFFAYIIDNLAHMRYFASVVGWWKAFWYTLFEMEMFSRND